MKALLTGLGIGMGLGVLLAPDRGEVTRRKIRERLSDVIDGFGHEIDKAKDVVQEAMTGRTEAARAPDQPKTDFPPKKDQAREMRSSANPDPINTLSREEFLTVTGIGPALADRIISGRPYSSRQELLQRGILPLNTFDELDRELTLREKRSA